MPEISVDQTEDKVALDRLEVLYGEFKQVTEDNYDSEVPIIWDKFVEILSTMSVENKFAIISAMEPLVKEYGKTKGGWGW